MIQRFLLVAKAGLRVREVGNIVFSRSAWREDGSVKSNQRTRGETAMTFAPTLGVSIVRVDVVGHSWRVACPLAATTPKGNWEPWTRSRAEPECATRRPKLLLPMRVVKVSPSLPQMKLSSTWGRSSGAPPPPFGLYRCTAYSSRLLAQLACHNRDVLEGTTMCFSFPPCTLDVTYIPAAFAGFALFLPARRFHSRVVLFRFRHLRRTSSRRSTGGFG